jgi:23S rRNA (guanosine2251-2'-O)-methyltransferase
MIFNTVLYLVKSPVNVGMITRSHVAFGGKYLIFLAYDEPWDFRKGSQSFSRKLESKCDILFFRSQEEFLRWSNEESLLNVAVEIHKTAITPAQYKFNENCNLIIGNEATGLPNDFLNQCDQIITIPQSSAVGSLNVAVSASIVMHELVREEKLFKEQIRGNSFE